jgi:micrococcal nuclease
MKPLLAFLLLFLTAPVQLPETVVCARVVSVIDGDTIKALTKDNELLRVRLRNIDAPEKSQGFGQRSKQNLSELVFGRDVELHVFGTDRYGRTLAVIMLDGVDINLQQVRDGYAWVYTRYIGENSLEVQAQYYDAQAAAQRERRGLWQDSDPVPPWEWRKIEKDQAVD